MWVIMRNFLALTKLPVLVLVICRKMRTLLRFTIAILLILLHQPVSSSETHVYVEKGQDVRLDVQQYTTVKENLKRFNRFRWMFNRSDNVVTYIHEISTHINPTYNSSVEFSQGNFSLVLKNLTEEDSGHYTAVVSGDKDKDVAEYQISVQKRVEPPVLTVNSSINGTCNVTVTCRGQNTSVTSSCNSSTCSQVGGESRGAETSHVPLLSVYVAGGSIICNHSNQVSWANDTKEMETICVSKSGPEWEEVMKLILIPIIIILILVGSGVGICWRAHANQSGKSEIINTDYASVGIQAGGEEQMSPGPASPSIYSVVGHHHPQPVNHPTMVEDQAPPVVPPHAPHA